MELPVLRVDVVYTNIEVIRLNLKHMQKEGWKKKCLGCTLFRTNATDQCFSTAGPRPCTGPWHQLYWAREILLELITDLNVILYLSAHHTVHIIVLMLFMIMP